MTKQKDKSNKIVLNVPQQVVSTRENKTMPTNFEKRDQYSNHNVFEGRPFTLYMASDRK